RSTLKLARSHLIVPGTDRNAQTQSFCLKINHEAMNPSRDRAKIMVFQLLAFGRSMPKQSSARHHKIRSCVIQSPVYKEIFLFYSQGSTYFHYIFVKIFVANGSGSFVNKGQAL